jgi:hypothetical protein
MFLDICIYYTLKSFLCQAFLPYLLSGCTHNKYKWYSVSNQINNNDNSYYSKHYLL